MAVFPPGVRRALKLPSSADRLSRELDDEVRFHLEQRAADLKAAGMSDAEAWDEALRRFGDADDLRDYCRSIEVSHMHRMRLREWWEGWTQDLRFGARQLLRAPGFFAVAVVTLALGIGASSAIFSVVRGVLLRPLPYPDPGNVVQLWQVGETGGQGQFSDRNFEDLKARSRSFAALAEITPAGNVSVSGIAEPVRTRAAAVMADFFTVVGIRPVVGRLFAPEELQENGVPAAVVSYGFWQRHLGAAPSAIGQKLLFDGAAFTVIGVMPPALQFPTDAEIWVPRELRPKFPSRTAHNFEVVGRLAPGVSLEQARREVSDIARQMKQEHGDRTSMSDVAVVPLQEQLVGKAASTLLVLLAGSLLLLLIACANVVNLLIARMAVRHSELALRAALGASRGRLAQQCLAESLMLAVAAAALGVGIAFGGVRLLLLLQPGNLPRMQDVRVDGWVLAFALGISVLAAVAMGVIAAIRSTGGPVRDALAEAQRTQGGSRSSERMRRALVVAQVGMAVVLLVAAGLFGRSFLRLLRVHPGFVSEQRVIVDVTTTVRAAELVALHDQLLDRFSAIPGVRAAGGTNIVPLGSGGGSNGTFLILRDVNETFASMEDFERLSRDPQRTGEAEYRVAGPGYFDAMGIPLVRGRSFESRDVAGAPHVAVISASLARTRWPDENPIGKVIQFGNMDGILTPFTIVGVVGDVRERSLALPPRPTFYASYRQRPGPAWRFNYVLSTAGDPASVMTAARRIVREARPDMPPRVRTIEAIVGVSVADKRFVLSLVLVFGAVALILATLGIYSVISYLVTQRARELSIRVALGAQRRDVLRMVLGQGMILALAGMVVGAIGALAASRVIGAMLYDLSPTDPIAFGGVMLMLVAVAMLATWLPARRAARAEAMDVLRA
jgi:putative ABC transport system permease protein